MNNFILFYFKFGSKSVIKKKKIQKNLKPKIFISRALFVCEKRILIEKKKWEIE